MELLQPGAPAQRQLSAAIAGECGGAAVVLAPLSRPHAETRALAIRRGHRMVHAPHILFILTPSPLFQPCRHQILSR